eukprot:7387460-Prymnesium_polylepis.1
MPPAPLAHVPSSSLGSNALCSLKTTNITGQTASRAQVEVEVLRRKPAYHRGQSRATGQSVGGRAPGAVRTQSLFANTGARKKSMLQVIPSSHCPSATSPPMAFHIGPHLQASLDIAVGVEALLKAGADVRRVDDGNVAQLWPFELHLGGDELHAA